MKVIFLQDVPSVAKAGDTKEVSDGYGRNFLLRKKLAVLADANADNVLERQRKIEAKRQAEMADIATRLNGTEITIKARAGAEDKLFGSVTAADIAEELHKVTGIEVDKRKVVLADPIKQLGNFEVDIKVARDVETKVKVTVVGEEAVQGEQGEQREVTPA